MRIPIALLALVLAAGAVLGWHDHRRLAGLRAVQSRLSEATAARGVSLDASGRPTKRQREDGAFVALELATELIDLAREVKERGGRPWTPDEAGQKRAEERAGRMMTLDKEQLKTVIARLHAAEDVDDRSRASFIRGLVSRLGRDHPEDAVAILTDNPEVMELMNRTTNGSAENLVYGLFRNWSSGNPAAAVAWVRENGGKFPESLSKMLPQALVSGAASNDPRLAFGLLDEMGLDAGGFLTEIARNAEPSTEHRKTVLAGLRGWGAAETDAVRRDQVFRDMLPLLVFGERHQPEDFNRATAWIESAGLSPQELGMVADVITDHAKFRELPRWMDWVVKTLPEESAPQPFGKLFSFWSGRDHKAAEAWLETAEDGPLRNAAILGYFDAVVENQPLAAARWTGFLPEGKEGKNRLWLIFRCWPKEDPGGRESFAKEHGLR